MDEKTTEELNKIVDEAYEQYEMSVTVFSLTDFEEAIIELTKREER